MQICFFLSKQSTWFSGNQTCASSEDSPGCRKRAADEQKRRRDSPAAPLNNDTHKTHTKLHPHADGHGHTRRHFWRPYQEIWSSPGLSVTEHKLMRTTVSVSVCVCVCVCVRDLLATLMSLLPMSGGTDPEIWLEMVAAISCLHHSTCEPVGLNRKIPLKHWYALTSYFFQIPFHPFHCP